MKKYKLDQFTRGWLVGDFAPSIIHTKSFEFMVRFYKAGEKEQKHIHKVADEITVIINGRFLIDGQTLIKGDVIHLLPGDSIDFECLENGANAVIKIPSVKGDKFIIN